MNRLLGTSRRRWVAIGILLAINYALASYALADRTPRVEIPYSYFKRAVELGNVVELVSQGETIRGRLREPLRSLPGGPELEEPTADFWTVRPAFAEPGLEPLLDEQQVLVTALPRDAVRSWWQTLLLGFGPTLLIVGALVWLMRSFGVGSMLRMGRSTARRYNEGADGNGRVTFEHVAGIEEAKHELVEIVQFLRDPRRFARLGGMAPKGVLLVGPPGTGKTLLARAVAGEAGVPFFSMGASEFVEMVAGVGASRVRDLFKQARAAAPSIVFIDELDAIGRARGQMAFGGSRESEQTLNQILTEMDGFSPSEGVIVLGATNRPDVLDPALLRPGRFDRRVFVHPPDKNGRAAILRVHTRDMPLGADVDLVNLAGATPGLSGAELRNLVNEAALLAAQRNKEVVEHGEFLDAFEKLVLGPARPLLLSFEERQRIAYHEAGHTILGLVVPGADPVNRVTIMPRGQSLGSTYQRPDDDRHTYAEGHLQARIIGALGGRAAEEIVYGTRTTAIQNDLQVATSLARLMVTHWGMSALIGPVSFSPSGNGFAGPAAQAAGEAGTRPYSELTSKLIDDEIRRILEECNQQAVHLLTRYREELDRLAAALLEQETLGEEEILRVTGLSRQPRQTTQPLVVNRG